MAKFLLSTEMLVQVNVDGLNIQITSSEQELNTRKRYAELLNFPKYLCNKRFWNLNLQKELKLFDIAYGLHVPQFILFTILAECQKVELWSFCNILSQYWEYWM